MKIKNRIYFYSFLSILFFFIGCTPINRITYMNENTLGELFCFFILETILIGESLKINPYDQPAVELIKEETKKLLT